MPPKPQRLVALKVVTDLLGVVALAAAIIGCLVYTVPALRERARAKRERIANCSHRWVYGNAMNDPMFPFRQCAECGTQEHLTRCLQCGRTLTRLQGGGLGQFADAPEDGDSGEGGVCS